MYLLEYAFFAILAYLVLRWFIAAIYRNSCPIPRKWAVLALALASLLWLFGLSRWQLVPASLLAALLVLASLRPSDYLRLSPATHWAMIGLSGLAVLIFACSAFLAWALPIPKIPAPTGLLPVGTFTLHVKDPSRLEVYTEDPADTREILLQVWYPAKPAKGQRPIPWLSDLDIFAPQIAAYLGLPSFILGHLAEVQSHSYENTRAAGDHDRFPVLIYSHGWTGFRRVAQNQCEELASHGYVVAAPEHTYGSMAAVFPDGRVALNNPKAMPPAEPKDARQKGIELLVDTYAGDLRLAMDELYKLHAGILPSPLAGRLDLSRIGLWGHSTGGGAITEVALSDPRVKAAAGLDPWVEPVSPELRSVRVEKPYLAIRCEAWLLERDTNNEILNEILPHFGGIVYDLYLANARHADFTLAPLLSPLMHFTGQTGRIDAHRALQVVDAALVAFFDQHLRGRNAENLQQPQETWPELRPVAKP